MRYLAPQIKNFLNDEGGATAVEYGLLIGLISLSLIVFFTQIGEGIGNILGFVVNATVGAEG